MKKKLLIMFMLLVSVLAIFAMTNTVNAAVCEKCSDKCTSCEAENCKCQTEGSEKCLVLVTHDNVVTCYDDLDKALKATQNGDTVQLINNVTLTGFVMASKNITFDLNGKTITIASGSGPYYGFYVVTNTVTFVDTAGNGKITDTTGKVALQVYSNGQAILNGGTYESTNGIAVQLGNGKKEDANPALVVVNNGVKINGNCGISLSGSNSSVEINGGEITGSNYALSGNHEETNNAKIKITDGTLVSSTSTAVYLPYSGNVTITGGTFTGKNFGLVNRCSTVTISGGTFKAETTGSTQAVGVQPPQLPTGYAIVVDNDTSDYKDSPAKVTISSGSFEGSAKDSLLSWSGSEEGEGTPGDFVLTGGTYKSDVTKWVADGYNCTGSGTKFTVAKKQTSTGGSSSSGETTTPSTDIVVQEVDKQTEDTNAKLGSVDKAAEKEVVIESLKEELKNNPELAAKLNGKTTEINVEFSNSSSESVAEEIKTKMEEVAKKLNKDIKIEEFYDIQISVLADGQKVGNLKELTKEIELKVNIPEKLPKVKEGYVRKYYIVREHDGEVSVLDTNVSKDGSYLTFKTDKFSTYALAYNDVEEAQLDGEPKMGESTMALMIAIICIALVAFVRVKSTKKVRRNRK